LRRSVDHAKTCACDAAREFRLEALNQIAAAVQVGQWLAARRGIQRFTRIVGKRVVDEDDAVVGDLHGGVSVWAANDRRGCGRGRVCGLIALSLRYYPNLVCCRSRGVAIA